MRATPQLDQLFEQLDPFRCRHEGIGLPGCPTCSRQAAQNEARLVEEQKAETRHWRGRAERAEADLVLTTRAQVAGGVA